MLFLFGAIAANLCMTFLMKYVENHGCHRYAVNIWNYLAGAIFSFFLLKDKSQLFVPDGGVNLALGALNGFLFVVALVFIQMSIARNGAPLTTTFNRLGVLIPTIGSAFLFAEIPGAFQIAGLALAIIAIIYMNGGGKEEKPTFMFGLIFIFTLGGVIDLISKGYSQYYGEKEQNLFVMYTFFFAMLVSIVIFLRSRQKMTVKDAIIGVGIGIPNQLTTLLVLYAATKLPAYVVYPTYSAGLIILVNAINYVVFREKLSKRQYIATAMIGVALILINL